MKNKTPTISRNTRIESALFVIVLKSEKFIRRKKKTIKTFTKNI